MPEERYEQLVATPNVNRADAGIEARNLDDALNALQVPSAIVVCLLLIYYKMKSNLIKGSATASLHTRCGSHCQTCYMKKL